ncbi:MAG: GNAT family acetyltransferase [Pseudomonadota bacterium]|nr:GNAT family acetyltransferase [Pseudomonadota bacterium]
MTGWSIRDFRPEDEAGLIEMWKQSGIYRRWNDPQRDIARKTENMQKTGFGLFLVVQESSGRIIGSVMAGYDGHRGSVNYLAVHPEAQKQGIGRALMAEVESWCESEHCPKINLLVRTDNQAVKAFYARLGYGVDEVSGLSRRLIED